MKEMFHKIVSIFMAIVVLFSTLSFTVGMHFCGDIFVEAAVFSETQGCGMDMHINDNDSTKENLSKEGCCSETLISIDGNEEFTATIEELYFNQQTFIASFVYSYINLYEEPEEKVSSFLDYSPPIVVKDILLLDEQFLI